MSFLGPLLALLWDQISPVYRPSQVDRLAGRYADWVYRNVNAGTRRHGLLAWCVAALLPALAVGLAAGLFRDIAYLLGLAWSAAVLYQLLGLRQIANQAGDLRDALLLGDVAHSRSILREMGVTADEDVGHDELTVRAVERVLQLGLSRIFGVLFWFVLFGPFGAVAYALTAPLAERWRGEGDFPIAVARAVDLLDWLPARLMVFCFAIVGNFDETLLRWRALNPVETRSNDAVLRAGGFGALGLDETAPDPDYVRGAASLLRRSALLLLGLLGLIWLGGL